MAVVARTRTRGRFLALAGVAALLATLGVASRAVAAAEAQAAPATCTLRASTPGDEWGSCMHVEARLDHVPALGETATVHVTVRSSVARPATRVALDVPSRMRFVESGPATLSTTRARNGHGTVRRATVRTDLAAGSVREYSYELRPQSTGPVHVYVNAVSGSASGALDVADNDLYFTVGTTAAGSHLGAAPAPTHGTTAHVPTGARVDLHPTAATSRQVLATAEGPRSTGAPTGHSEAPSGQGCVTGGWFYVDNNGVTRPAKNESVEAWDHDSLSGDDRLAVGVVGFDGRFQLCFSDDDGIGDTTQEVYVKYLTTNTRWRVRDTAAANNTYTFQTETVDVCSGCDHEYGNRQPSDSSVMGGLHAFDELGDLWLFVEGGSQNCFDSKDTSCRQMIANWTSTSTDGTRYIPSTKDIHLKAESPNSQYTVVHEGSHALMDDVYSDAIPNGNCPVHDIPTAGNAVCAWVEGFAEWLPAEVYNNPIYMYPDQTTRNLETPTWNTSGWADGDTVEGRIAGTLLDISDSTNEAPWDFTSEGRGTAFGVYRTFLNTVSSTLNEFLTVDRVAQGFEFSDSGSRGSAYQNTIDYDFRDPLTTRAERVRPTPVPAQHYVANTAANYWSVVAIRPPGDYDIAVYDNRDLSGFLAQSTSSGGTMDFVAIDGNRRPAGDYYPTVTQYAPVGATGDYGVEFVEGNTTVSDGSHNVFFTSGDLVQTEDSFLSAGVPTWFRVVPAAGQDLETFVLRSTSGSAGTYVQSRGSAVTSANAGGAGVAESLVYTESASQYDAFVVTNRNAAAGTYTVYRDTTPPTGSVAVQAGAPRTNYRNVTAYISASDAQTGVYQMRVSFDGALDTEPWVPYSTTATGTLPAGDGTKTVTVQFRNNAGQPSGGFSDTIVLDQRPNLRIASISNPPGSARRGHSFSVTDTTRNIGSSSTGVGSSTRYYLSTDTNKNSADILLGGARAVPVLNFLASNTGSRSVTVPSGAALGKYYLIACADVGNKVAEFSELDNCKASTTKVTITT
jgi:hypothetical protein